MSSQSPMLGEATPAAAPDLQPKDKGPAGPLPSPSSPSPSPQPQDVSNAAPPGPSHDLSPSLIHSWAQFWELRWGWLSWGGVGAPGLGKAPPARGPDPLARSAELSGRWRQPAACGPSSAAAAARDLLFRADAIRRFPVSVLAPRWRPRVQPGGRGSGLGPSPSQAPPRGPSPTACTDPRPSGLRLPV